MPNPIRLPENASLKDIMRAHESSQAEETRRRARAEAIADKRTEDFAEEVKNLEEAARELAQREKMARLKLEEEEKREAESRRSNRGNEETRRKAEEAAATAREEIEQISRAKEKAQQEAAEAREVFFSGAAEQDKFTRRKAEEAAAAAEKELMEIARAKERAEQEALEARRVFLLEQRAAQSSISGTENGREVGREPAAEGQAATDSRGVEAELEDAELTPRRRMRRAWTGSPKDQRVLLERMLMAKMAKEVDERDDRLQFQRLMESAQNAPDLA